MSAETRSSLLVELFVEELPPKALKKLGESFASVLVESLRAQGLCADASEATSFASPRRLAVHISKVAAKGADKLVQQKLVPVSIGLDANGKATPVLLKKLAALGVVADPLPNFHRATDGKAETLFLNQMVTGTALGPALQKAIDETLQKLPISKVMTYQAADGWSGIKFVRPAHGLVALHGAEVVPVQALALQSGRMTQGHRFESLKPVIVVRDADGYAAQLESEGAVIASFALRRAEIVRQLTAKAQQEGLVPIDDDALLDEVTGLWSDPTCCCAALSRSFAGAAGVPHLDDEAEPKVFSAARRAGSSDRPLPRREQHPAHGCECGDHRQRASRAATSCRCALFLSAGSQEDSAIARSLSCQGCLPQQARHAGRTRRAGARDCEGDSAAARRRGTRSGGGSRGAAGKGGLAHRNGGRVPRTARHHGRLLRSQRRRVRGDRGRDRGSLQTALLR